MALLTAEQLTTPMPVKRVRVDIPELDGHVFVQTMTAWQKGQFDSQFSQNGKVLPERRQELRERTVVACVCDDAGKRLLTYDDVKALGQQRCDIVNTIFEAADDLLNGREKKDDTDTAAGNSGETSDD